MQVFWIECLFPGNDGYLIVLCYSQMQRRRRLAYGDGCTKFHKGHGRGGISSQNVGHDDFGAHGELFKSWEEDVCFGVHFDQVILSLIIIDGELQEYQVGCNVVIVHEIGQNEVQAFFQSANVGSVMGEIVYLDGL